MNHIIIIHPKSFFFSSEERDAAAVSAYMPTSQSELQGRRMMDSYREAYIPLGTSARLREKYINFWNGVRFGRIMEDLDTMAGESKDNLLMTQDHLLSVKR